jgi:hypothetical protein
MDTNGARALAARIGDRSIDPAAIPSPHALSDTARPILHWFGVEPPEPADDATERDS